jgi:predicted secreted protein
MPTKILWLLLMCVLSTIQACSQKMTDGGSDHPNELVGTVIDSTNAQVIVRLYSLTATKPSVSLAPDLFIANSIQETVANEKGAYRFADITEGDYYIEVIRDDSTAVNISNIITIPTQGTHIEWPIELEDIALRIPGRVLLDSASCTGSFFALGTHYQSSLENQECTIPYIPSGKSYQIALASNPDSVKETVFIQEGTHPDYTMMRSTPQKRFLLPGNTGDSILVIPNDTVSVRLSANASTGYTWEDYSDATISQTMEQQADCPEGSQAIGEGCDQLFQWIIPADFSEPATIYLSYERTWEPGSASVEFRIYLHSNN